MHPHALPNAALLKNMSIRELMDATLRLSDLLAEESEIMTSLRFKELPKLHEEKVKLTQLLESYQQVMATNPEFLRQADAKTREELLLLTDDLAVSVEENFRKVSVARAVNSRVMQAINDVMREDHGPSTYGRTGHSYAGDAPALSFNFNQKA